MYIIVSPEVTLPALTRDFLRGVCRLGLRCVGKILRSLRRTVTSTNVRINLPYGHHFWLIMAPYNNSYLRNERSSYKKSNTLHYKPNTMDERIRNGTFINLY